MAGHRGRKCSITPDSNGHRVLSDETSQCKLNRYHFTPAPLLVEEEFEGEGYGLPVTAAPGERLERLGPSRMRLSLRRPVDPLVVRALASPRMRLLLPQGELLLASLGAPAVALEALGCPTSRP